MTTHIKDSIHHAFDRLKTLHSRQQNSGGSTGLESLDTVLGGIHACDLIILAGFPDSYKTTLVLQTLLHNLIIKNRSTFFVSPALSSLQITNRLIALTPGMSLDEISGGMLEDQDWEKLTRTLGMLKDSKLIISDNRELAKSKDEFIKDLRDIIDGDQIEFVFIDLVQINATEGWEDYIYALKELAHDFGITIYLVINIPVPAVQESQPSYSHLEAFGNIGDYANALCFVHKEIMLDPLEIGDEEVKTIVLSNYARSCRLFIDEGTQRLVEESEYRARYIDSVGEVS